MKMSKSNDNKFNWKNIQVWNWIHSESLEPPRHLTAIQHIKHANTDEYIIMNLTSEV